MPTKQQIKLAGELYVASELSRRGFNVGLTLGNVELVDLLVEKDNRHFSIQVKAIRRRQNNSFQINNKQIVNDYWYVFVNINSENLADYQCAIMKGSEVRRKLRMPRDEVRNGLLVGVLDDSNYKDKWERLGNQ